MSEHTKVYLNGELLPVPPEKITRSIKNQNKTMTTIGGQQINMIRPAGLTEITLSKVLLPNTAYDFMDTNTDGSKMSAQYYLDLLENYKQGTEPITLTINDSEDGLCNEETGGAYLVTLEDYKIEQSAENGKDIEVEIKLKQYVEYGLESVTIEQKTTKKKKNKRTEKNTEEQTYVVQKGDTLWAIAKKFYGDGSKYPYLAKLNNISNPNLIYPGQVLKIGSKADALASSSAGSSSKTTTNKTSSTTERIGSLGFSDAAIKLEVEKTVKDADVNIQAVKELESSRPYASTEAAKKDAAKGVTPASSKLPLSTGTTTQITTPKITIPGTMIDFNRTNSGGAGKSHNNK